MGMASQVRTGWTGADWMDLHWFGGDRHGRHGRLGRLGSDGLAGEDGVVWSVRSGWMWHGRLGEEGWCGRD